MQPASASGCSRPRPAAATSFRSATSGCGCDEVDTCPGLDDGARGGEVKRTSLRRKHLLRLILYQCGTCGICGDILPGCEWDVHIDHKVPLSKGGTDDPINLQATCARCNLSKGNNMLGNEMSRSIMNLAKCDPMDQAELEARVGDLYGELNKLIRAIARRHRRLNHG